MNLLFVDHIDHARTASSTFFVDMLKGFFDVEVKYIDPDKLGGIDLHVDPKVDIAVLWQVDFLAPLFLARGIKTIVIPMYDGSALMPDLHWLWAKHAGFINFSRRLHFKVTRLGVPSLLVKYFKPAVDEDKRATFDDGLKAFLWQRRPEEKINLRLAEHLLGGQVASIHVHDAPDDPNIDTAPYMEPTLSTYKLTVSKWFKSGQEYQRLLDQCNVFIAPRRAEGIAMTLLEAMSRGMLIFVADGPVHNEYIANWVNGVLFNPDSPGQADYGAAPSLGRMAWRTAQEGREKWLKTQPKIIDFIKSIPAPPKSDVNFEALSNVLLRAYGAGFEGYGSYLISHVADIERMTGASFRGQITPTGNYDPNRITAQLDEAAAVSPNRPWLEKNRLSAETAVEGRHNVSGSFQGFDGAAWIVGHSVALGFRLDSSLGQARTLRLQFRRPKSVEGATPLCVILNGWTLWIGELAEPVGLLDIDIPAESLSVDNVLQIQCKASALGYGPQPVSLGLEHIEFV